MILIKAGGGKKINWDFIAEDIKELMKKQSIIIVHGASSYRDEIAKKLKAPTKTIISPSGISSVYTDKKAIEIFLMVYAGLINKQIVAKLQSYRINAVGLSGVDGRLWSGKRKTELLVQEGTKTKLIKNNMSGQVEFVNTHLINLLIDNNYVPVICPPAISYDNEIINTDNDLAITVMIKSLNVKEVVSLFEAPGILKNFPDQTSMIKKINKNQLRNYMPFAQGRMKKKLLGAIKAFDMGLKTMYWGDGRIKNPIINAMKGKGTIIS